MNFKTLPNQPSPIVSYLKVGKLLYVSLVLFFLESWIYWIQLEKAYSIKHSTFWSIFWFGFFLFSFVHIILVLADGWSRYQNYKKAKDQFYIYGFKKRIANLYIVSKCQRMAAIVAADELGLGSEIKEHYASKGVKWFHYIPYFMVKDPLFLFRKYFWKRTFLEKEYKSKFNYHKIQLELLL